MWGREGCILQIMQGSIELRQRRFGRALGTVDYSPADVLLRLALAMAVFRLFCAALICACAVALFASAFLCAVVTPAAAALTAACAVVSFVLACASAVAREASALATAAWAMVHAGS